MTVSQYAKKLSEELGAEIKYQDILKALEDKKPGLKYSNSIDEELQEYAKNRITNKSVSDKKDNKAEAKSEAKKETAKTEKKDAKADKTPKSESNKETKKDNKLEAKSDNNSASDSNKGNGPKKDKKADNKQMPKAINCLTLCFK